MLFREFLHEFVNYAIKLHRIVDKQRVSIPVEPLQPNPVAKLCLQEVGIWLQRRLIGKEHGTIDGSREYVRSFLTILLKLLGPLQQLLPRS